MILHGGKIRHKFFNIISMDVKSSRPARTYVGVLTPSSKDWLRMLQMKFVEDFHAAANK